MVLATLAALTLINVAANETAKHLVPPDPTSTRRVPRGRRGNGP
ncbi:hypothetical protein [Micromonospora aurantiaca (nom. illeg.)]